MKIETIYYSSHFERAFRKLSYALQEKARQKEKIFREDCYDPKLRTHKLQGELSSHWSFSVDYSYRIVFEFLNDGSVLFTDIGPHNVYQ